MTSESKGSETAGATGLGRSGTTAPSADERQGEKTGTRTGEQPGRKVP